MKGSSPGLLTRLGLAIVKPRAALAIAGGRDHPGRSGSDLLLALIILILVTQLRALVSAAWLGIAIEPGLGVRAIVQSLTDVLAVDLGFLVISALVIWIASAPRRDLGRASDLACVAVLPLVFVDLVATVVVLGLDLPVTRPLMSALSLIAYSWTGILVAFAVMEARRAPGPVVPPVMATRAGQALAGVVALGLVVQGVWLVRHFDRMAPVVAGDPAPDFSLPRIGAKGALGEKLALSSLRGQPVILDFWATWCGPCLAAMPKLQAFQQRHPELTIVTINLDDAAEARALFEEKGYTLALVAADAQVTDQYDVSAIPHTVVIDAQGRVRRVVRGGKVDLEREIAGLSAELR